jgi:hypothetical protein
MITFIKKNKYFILICLAILIICVFTTSYSFNEGFLRGRINVLPTTPSSVPSYFTSCGDATQYGCSTCLNAVIRDAPSTKCGWKDTGHLVNGNQKQYICESDGPRVCPM